MDLPDGCNLVSDGSQSISAVQKEESVRDGKSDPVHGPHCSEEALECDEEA